MFDIAYCKRPTQASRLSQVQQYYKITAAFAVFFAHATLLKLSLGSSVFQTLLLLLSLGR